MSLRNITLKTAELGPVLWENVEKLQPSEKNFILFLSYEKVERTDDVNQEDGKEYLIGTYIDVPFVDRPTVEQVADYIIETEYKDNKELATYEVRKGIIDDVTVLIG